MTELEQVIHESELIQYLLVKRESTNLTISNISQKAFNEARIKNLLGEKILNYAIIKCDKSNNSVRLIKLD